MEISFYMILKFFGKELEVANLFSMDAFIKHTPGVYNWTALTKQHLHSCRSSFLFSVFLFIQDDSDEPDLDGVALGLLTFANNDAGLYNALRVSVVIEGAVVMSVSRHTDVFLIMFGLMYALHLSYPKALINTFEFVQKILLGLDGGKLSPKLQTMKIDLSMWVWRVEGSQVVLRKCFKEVLFELLIFCFSCTIFVVQCSGVPKYWYTPF